MQASSTHPLLILNEIDIACRKTIDETTTPVKFKNNTWSGIGFRIEEDELIIQNIYIDEVIDANFQHNLSTVPGAKPWLLGLISLRGQPLPVIDLKQYLFNQPSRRLEHSRLIVIKNGNFASGLFIEHVYGLKQFPVNSETIIEEDSKNNSINVINNFSENIKPYIDKTFNDNGLIRGNLSISRLTNNTDFANAAR